VIASSALAVLGPVIIARVVLDHLLLGASGPDVPYFGMLALTEQIAATTGMAALPAACLLYGLTLVGCQVSAHGHRVLLSRAALGALGDLRRDLFAHLEHRPASFYDRVAVGRVMTRVTNDIEVLFELLAGLGALLGELVPFAVALLLMLAVSPALALALLAAVPLVALATYLYRRATTQVYRAIRSSVSRLNQNLQENLSGIQVVQLHGREELNLARYTEINQENRHHEYHAIRLETRYNPSIQSLATAALGVVLWLGGVRALEGALTLGSVVLFTQYIDMLFRPIVRVGEQYNVLYRAMASGERIFQALDWHEALPEPAAPARLPQRLGGRVEIRQLSFAYAPGSPVLQDVSLSVEPGEKLAIVGPTGSGKTTLVRLLGRFYDVAPGHVFLDGIDVCDLETRELRRRLGFVLQDFHVFAGSVADNIALGDPAISRERVVEAARLVHAHTFIEALPGGYDAPLDERGQNLSHGQRQLLAFARVLAADPEILILDEATASIDTETEVHIQAALRQLTAGRTAILIAHRLQTIREADRIAVLERGRLRELGTHDELLARRGLYHTLHALQFQTLPPA